MSKISKVREAELIKDIARQLDPSQRGRIRAQCENWKDEFRALHSDELSPTEKRDTFLAVERTCRKAAKAVAALQDDDLPKGRYVIKGRQFEFSVRSTWLTTLLWLVSEIAGERAKKQAPLKARTTPEKDSVAHFAFVLATEFGKAKPSRSPQGPYLVVATLLYEYLTGLADQSLENSCRKVLREYPSHPRPRRRQVAAG
jgi:hypothetical protein